MYEGGVYRCVQMVYKGGVYKCYIKVYTGVYRCVQVFTGVCKRVYRCYTQVYTGVYSNTQVRTCSYITYVSCLDSVIFGPDLWFLDGQKVGSCYCNDCTSTGEHRETPREVGLDR